MFECDDFDELDEEFYESACMAARRVRQSVRLFDHTECARIRARKKEREERERKVNGNRDGRSDKPER